jgi:hypothetical protein
MQTRTENNGTPTRTANSAKVERFLKKIDDLQFIEETRRSAEHIPAPGVGYWRAVDLANASPAACRSNCMAWPWR